METQRDAPVLVGVDGIQLRVSVRPGPGTPLLLCNGIGGAIELVEPFRTALGHYPTITFDAPGVAGSGLHPYPPTIAGIARTVIKALDKLGVGEIDVLGVSWGGALAQQLAFRNPGRVRRLVLCATGAGPFIVPGSPRVLAMMATPLRYWSPSYLRRVAPTLYGPDMVDDPTMVDQQAHIRFTRGPSGRGYLYQVLALRRFSSALWLHRVQQPTLVLHGDADPIVPLVNGKLLASRIPNARLQVVPSGGHLFLLTRADSIAVTLRDFLAD